MCYFAATFAIFVGSVLCCAVLCFACDFVFVVFVVVLSYVFYWVNSSKSHSLSLFLLQNKMNICVILCSLFLALDGNCLCVSNVFSLSLVFLLVLGLKSQCVHNFSSKRQMNTRANILHTHPRVFSFAPSMSMMNGILIASCYTRLCEICMHIAICNNNNNNNNDQ